MDISTLERLIEVSESEEKGGLAAEKRAEAAAALSFSEEELGKVMDAFDYLRSLRSSVLSSSSEFLDAFFESDFEHIPAKDYEIFNSIFLSSLQNSGIDTSTLAFPVISRELAESPLYPGAERVEAEEVENEENASVEEKEEEPAGTEEEAVEEEDRIEKIRASLGEKKWTRLMYMVIQTKAAGESDEKTEKIYGRSFEAAGGCWASASEIAGDIYNSSFEDGHTREEWISGTVPLSYVKEKFYDARFEEMCAHKEAERAAYRAIRKAALTYGSPGVESYILTDGDIEDMASYYIRGTRYLRSFTDSAMYNADLSPAEGGIFSEKLLGPLQYDTAHKSQNCMCGFCSRTDTDADAKAGFVCPECGSAIMSSDDREKTYGLIESPFPLLMGRGELVSMMLDDSDGFIVRGLDVNYSIPRIVDLLGKCDPHVYIDDDMGALVVNDTGRDMQYIPGRIYGTEALEIMLRRLSGKTETYNGKEYPAAVINAMRNLSMQAGKLKHFSKDDTEEERNMKKRNLSSYNRKLNYFSTIAATLIDRGGEPEDFLLHYIPVPPVATRMPNDRNGSSDYGEDNKLYSSLIRQKNIVEDTLKAGNPSSAVWAEYEKEFTADVDKLVAFAGDSFYNKNGRLYKKLMSTRADDCIRSVITPSDHKKGQGWLRLESGGELDIPEMDLIGLPRFGLRTMYRPEIERELRKMGCSEETIIRAFDEPAGAVEIDENGNERRCLVDRVLDEVMLNRDPETGNARGRMVLYMRHPVITDGSVQAAYAYPVDHYAIEFPVARCKAMNADFDGDTGLAVKIEAPDRDPDTGYVLTPEDKKAFMQTARSELKRHMDSTVYDRGTDELLVGPRLESLYGLYKASGPVESYTFTDRVIVNREELGKLEAKGVWDSRRGILAAQASVYVNHVIDEIREDEVQIEYDRVVPPGTVYAVKNGVPVRADENIKLLKRDGKVYAVTPLNDYIRCPKGAEITEKDVLEEGEELCFVDEVTADRDEIIDGLFSGQFVYNQPIYTLDGEETTPARIAIENIFGHRLPFGSEGFNSKAWEKMLKEEIAVNGIERGKKVISNLTRFGFAVHSLIGDNMKIEHFPSTAPITNKDIFDRNDYSRAIGMAFGHEDIKGIVSVVPGLPPYGNHWDALDQDNMFQVKKGTEYGKNAEGETLTAEYDMYLARFKGQEEYFARDMVNEERDYREYSKARKSYLAAKKLVQAKGADATAEDKKNLESERKRMMQLWIPLYDRRRHLRSVYVNEYRTERYEKKREETAEKVVAQVVHQKNNFLKDCIKAGVKKEDLAVSMAAVGVTKDYAGNPMEIVLGSLIHGLKSDMRVMNETTAVINGNKTLYVDIIGAIGNMLMAGLEGCRYEEGDCGTKEYREHEMPEDEESVKKLAARLDGRTIADDMITPEGEVLAAKGETFTPSLVMDAYHKGVRKLPQRSAAYCRCRGICEACAGKMRGLEPEFGTELGFSAKNALVAPFSQGTMSRAKAADGGKMENGAEVLMNLVSGAYMKGITGESTIRDFAEEFADAFYDSGKIKLDALPPVYTELFAKAFVYYKSPETGLAESLHRAVLEGKDLEAAGAESGFINYDAGMLQDTEMSYMAKDKRSSKLGAFGGRSVPKVRRDTIYREKHGRGLAV